mmetsp:Transcript_7037/g.11114  ORF Transcript_7037/g.11114 Transcript_7037/m.11114 type:complete len:86 (+) Transcript_7037:1753-2010(+)
MLVRCRLRIKALRMPRVEFGLQVRHVLIEDKKLNKNSKYNIILSTQGQAKSNKKKFVRDERRRNCCYVESPRGCVVNFTCACCLP